MMIHYPPDQRPSAGGRSSGRRWLRMRSDAASGDASVDHDGHRDGKVSPSEQFDSDSGSQRLRYGHDNSEAADRGGETGATFLNIPIGLCLILVDG